MVASELAHGREGTQRSLRQLRDGEVPELTRNLPGIEQQAQIGGRKASCQGRRLFLNVVGDEPVVLRRTEFVEVPPGAQRDLAKK